MAFPFWVGWRGSKNKKGLPFLASLSVKYLLLRLDNTITTYQMIG